MMCGLLQRNIIQQIFEQPLKEEVLGYLPLTKQIFLKLLVLKPCSLSGIFICIDQKIREV